LVGLLLAACAEEPKTYAMADVPCDGATWVVPVEGPGAQVELFVGERVALSLPLQAGAGYFWTPRGEAAAVAIERGKVLARAPGDLRHGGPIRQCLSIRGVAEGSGALLLDYRRAQEPDPMQTVDLRMDIRWLP
jgi:hypothetical protein